VGRVKGGGEGAEEAALFGDGVINARRRVLDAAIVGAIALATDVGVNEKGCVLVVTVFPSLVSGDD